MHSNKKLLGTCILTRYTDVYDYIDYPNYCKFHNFDLFSFLYESVYGFNNENAYVHQIQRSRVTYYHNLYGVKWRNDIHVESIINRFKMTIELVLRAFLKRMTIIFCEYKNMPKLLMNTSTLLKNRT